MFLSKLFRHARKSALVILGGFALLLGAGASISVAQAAQVNEVVETKAGTTAQNQKTTLIYTEDQRGYSFCTLHVWGCDYEKYDGTNNYQNSDLEAYFIATYGARYTSAWNYQYKSGSRWAYNGGSSGDYLITPNGTSGNYPHLSLYLPWWVKSCYVQMTNGNDGWLPDKGYGMNNNAGLKGYVKMYYNSSGNMYYDHAEDCTTKDFDAYNVTINMRDSSGTDLGNSTTNEARSSFDYYYPSSTPTLTGYTFSGSYFTNAACTTPYSWSKPSADVTIYALMTINNYTINYTFVVDGVPQTDRYWNGSSWASGSLTGSTSANYGTLFNALAEPTLYGASFDGWYSDSTCKTALSTTAIAKNYGATEAYAKFTTDSSSSNLYVGIDGSVGQNKYLLRSWSADAQGYTWVYYTNGTKSAGIKVQELTSISVSGWKYFRFRVPSDATSVVLCKGEWGTTGAYQAQTIDLHPGSGSTTATDSYANGHNLFVVGSTQTENAKRTGEWKDIQYYLDVASNTAFTANLTTHTMSAPNNPSTGNTAEVMKVSVPSGYYVRGKYVVNGTTGYNITKGGEDGSSSSSVYSEQTSGVGVHFKAAKTCNFYINTSGDIWIVDCSGITAGGYLYISTQLTPAQIKVDCSVGGSDYFSGAKLSTVDDVLSTTTLTYDGVKGLIIVPIYHLRKGETKSAGTAYSITLTSASDSSRTTSVTGVTVNSSNKVYTINLSTASSWSASTAVSETYGSVATLAYDIDAAVKAAENGSVCNVYESTASALATRYNTLAETSDYRTKLEAASIESYNYGWSMGVGTYEKDVMISNGSKGAIGLAYIYAELCNRCDVAPIYAPAGARFIPNNKEDSPLTMTLWIVLGAGMAGLAAIGTAYFVSKRKEKNHHVAN